MARIVKSLNGSDWKFQSFKDGAGIKEIFGKADFNFSEWMPATVPGNVRLDLMRNNKITDPWYGKNNKESQWVNKFEWWYQKEFELTELERANRIIHLVCKAVDYVAEFWLNGMKLGDHEGMFGRISFDITETVKAKNVLLIRLAALKNYPNRFDVVKCQMSYGWDWAPKMVPSGIWDDIFIELKEKIFIDSCFIRSTLENNSQAIVKISLDVINCSDANSIVTTIKIEGKNFETEPLTKKLDYPLNPGLNHISWEIPIKNPSLWYPWDKGKPNLYTITIEIAQNGTILDTYQDTHGIRHFQLLSQNIDPEYYPWIFEINGEKEYIRGANWVPPDMLFGQIDHNRYEQNLKLAKEANINLLRVWGGGLKEKDDFYKICDEEGILIWQEFPIACAFLSPFSKDDHFLKVWKTEAESIVKDIRNHPCLVIWCGGNEVNSKDNAHVIDILKTAVEGYDERIFIPASPEGGDNHNYEVFHGLGHYSLYLEDEFPFASEFGLSSFPNYSTLENYIPKNELFFWSPTINYHAPYMVFFQGHKKNIQRYALPFSPPDDLPTIIYATQQAQGLGLKTAIEHYRRRKLDWKNAGCAIWQFDSPWPCTSHCIVEYDFSKKLSFEFVRVAYQPILVSLNYNLKIDFNKKDKSGNLINRKFEAEVFLINDLTEKFSNCNLKIEFLTQNNEIIDQIERTIDVPANTCIQLESLSYEFPDNLQEPPRIQLQLTSNKKNLSKNFYNTSYFDPMQPRKMPKISKRMSDILFYSKSSRAVRLLKNTYYVLRIIPYFAHLFIKIKLKWKWRKKAILEYVDLKFLKEIE
ncbi:MAG TPA: glycoside hydrolase family 2 TIM barrel-domain containing protein [Candidatus Deferrimicrobium sp.]|nr:glycoside hydrolase family 2 TIM barrel-domain containing protein [Candidatus Deferrimicrobium sp.]